MTYTAEQLGDMSASLSTSLNEAERQALRTFKESPCNRREVQKIFDSGKGVAVENLVVYRGCTDADPCHGQSSVDHGCFSTSLNPSTAQGFASRVAVVAVMGNAAPGAAATGGTAAGIAATGNTAAGTAATGNTAAGTTATGTTAAGTATTGTMSTENVHTGTLELRVTGKVIPVDYVLDTNDYHEDEIIIQTEDIVSRKFKPSYSPQDQ
ncbi:hypothetical protein HDU89_006173 [Geranomyces variabilis]|nr:hypothetical protein HDU89_006173 [Geranomyces variabilis]